MPATRDAARTFLVTGATGFLGRRLVAALLRRREADRVIAMARPGDRQHDDAQRHIAAEAGGGLNRLEWLTGDITQPGLGLDDSTVARLACGGELHVLHLAALYDLAVEEGMSKALNLDGAVHAYELALTVRRHASRDDRPVRFCHTSTLAVAGTYDGEFGETGEELSLAAGKHTDWYSRHKYESELTLRTLAESGEVPLMIVRPGIAVGEADTGAIEKLDGPYVLLEYVRWPIIRHLVPSGSDDPLWIVPGDFVVRAIAALGASPQAYGQTYNLLYPPGEAPIWRELVRETLRLLRSPEVAGTGLGRIRACLRYGWYVPQSVRGVIWLCECPGVGRGMKRLFSAMGVDWHGLHYAVDNPRYVVENYRKQGVEPPPPWRAVWRRCVLYCLEHRDEMKAGARVAHQKDD